MATLETLKVMLKLSRTKPGCCDRGEQHNQSTVMKEHNTKCYKIKSVKRRAKLKFDIRTKVPKMQQIWG